MLPNPNETLSRQARDGWDARVALQRLEGEVELMKEVIQLMVQAMGDRQADLAAAAQASDFARMRQHTHAMLASLKVLGFDEEAHIFEDFEWAAIASDQATCQRLKPHVQGLWAGIIDALAAYHATQH
jgi:hypothetical protein